MTRKIIVTTTFVGFHCWPDAPDEVSYLRQLHRHVFTAKVEFAVKHNGRQREFHIEKNRLEAALLGMPKNNDVTNWSCEAWAESLLLILAADAVEVWEDMENGARVQK